MNPWTEFHIGFVFFFGLFATVVSGIVILIYLHPSKKAISSIAGKFARLSNYSFRTTLLFAGMLGALSVTFKDCNGKYESLLESPYKTAMKGVEQVSSAFDYFAIALGFWLVIFIVLRIHYLKTNNK